MIRAFIAPAALSLFVLMTACQSTDRSPRPGLPDPIPAPYNDPQISVIDADLHQWLAFHPAVRVMAEGRPMQIEVPVRNLGDDQYLIQYRFLFYDANGFEEEPQMSWTRVPIGPKAVIHLKGTAYSRSSRDWRLEVRWAR